MTCLLIWLGWAIAGLALLVVSFYQNRDVIHWGWASVPAWLIFTAAALVFGPFWHEAAHQLVPKSWYDDEEEEAKE